MPIFKEYDIEVLKNIFTLAVFKPYSGSNGVLDIYYLTKDSSLFEYELGEREINGKKYITTKQLELLTKKHVLTHNKNFNGDVNLYNILSLKGVLKLLNTFGISNDTTRTIKNNDNEYRTFVFNGVKYPIQHFTRDVDEDYNKRETFISRII